MDRHRRYVHDCDGMMIRGWWSWSTTDRGHFSGSGGGSDSFVVAVALGE